MHTNYRTGYQIFNDFVKDRECIGNISQWNIEVILIRMISCKMGHAVFTRWLQYFMSTDLPQLIVRNVGSPSWKLNIQGEGQDQWK